ncbi:hypothetical protein GOBAR_AA01156 [Gossypium barbadense]|uniref:Alpha/beta hydrolase fold-3 domain-containing protein n=1 Tax=Gossypium barbadense TaxID=3634 RepID=A0A2P5YUY3_GOSBA|nr:hypothetical protein GOBAR_AA01156 [Gossypium barbadense]
MVEQHRPHVLNVLRDHVPQGPREQAPHVSKDYVPKTRNLEALKKNLESPREGETDEEPLELTVQRRTHQGPEAWLNDHADFERVLLGGESAGANIAHNLAIVARDPEFRLNVLLLGIALVHPYFWGSEPIGSEALNPDGKAVVDRLWPFLCPANQDNNDPRVNPVSTDGPSLVGLGCRRVLVCVAEKDVLRDRRWRYYELWGQVGGWA